MHIKYIGAFLSMCMLDTSMYILLLYNFFWGDMKIMSVHSK